MKQITREFADDIDTIRQAPDFQGQASLDILIGALQQGVEIYPLEWRENAMEERGRRREREEQNVRAEGER